MLGKIRKMLIWRFKVKVAMYRFVMIVMAWPEIS